MEGRRRGQKGYKVIPMQNAKITPRYCHTAKSILFSLVFVCVLSFFVTRCNMCCCSWMCWPVTNVFERILASSDCVVRASGARSGSRAAPELTHQWYRNVFWSLTCALSGSDVWGLCRSCMVQVMSPARPSDDVDVREIGCTTCYRNSLMFVDGWVSGTRPGLCTNCDTH